MKPLRALVGGALLLVGWISAIGAIKIARGLYENSSDWIPVFVIAMVTLGAGAWLIRPLVHVRPLGTVFDRPFVVCGAMAFAGSLLIAMAPVRGTIGTALVFLVYSLAAPIRLHVKERWARRIAALSGAWFLCWLALTGVGNEMRVDSKQLGLVAIVSLVAFAASSVLSAILRLVGRR